MASISLAEIADLLGVVPTPADRVFARLSSFAEAGEDSIVFALDRGSREGALASKAGLILAPPGLPDTGDERVLTLPDPKYGFALLARHFDRFREPVVHPTAVIEGSLGRRTAVGARTLVEAGAVVGEYCSIGPNVTIHGCVKLGDRCLVQAGAILGGMGFGYARGPDGRYVRFPQIGTLRIEDDVEIGANTTIDRGALGETSIGRGTKIDNLVHIAHNCRIGENVIMAAQVGLAGSCVIEDGAMLGGQVGLGEKVTVGKGVILGGQGGLLPGKRLDGEGQVFWGTPARPVREYLRDLARMRKS